MIETTAVNPAARASPRGWLGFLRGQRGSVAAWAAFMIIPLLGFIGLGLDTARGYMVRARLSQALDSAALAAGKFAYDSTKATAEANKMFKANFPTGYMDATVTGPTLTFNSTLDTVTVDGSAVLPTYFVHLIGFDTFTVSASTEVTRKTVYMDVIVSVDVSGSMDDYVGGARKIDAARAAAQTLVDTLFGSSETKDLLKMGLVTWNSNVRILDIGQSYSRSNTTSKTVTAFKSPYNNASSSNITTVWYAKDSPVPLISRPANGWTGCTHARFNHDSTDNDADIYVDFPTLGTKAWKAYKPAFTNSYDSDVTMQCPSQGIRRLVNTKSLMTTAVNGIKNPSGNTNIAMGLVWAWTVLAPKGSGSPFEADSTPTPAPGEGEMVRAIVLMTDGDNDNADGDAYEGRLSDSKLDDRAKAAAVKIKDSGVIIYTIRFGSASGAETLLKNLASGPTAPYYQYAPDAASLKSAFQEIGNHLSALRLSK